MEKSEAEDRKWMEKQRKWREKSDAEERKRIEKSDANEQKRLDRTEAEERKREVEAGRLLRTDTRPTLNLLPIPRGYRHDPIWVECLF